MLKIPNIPKFEPFRVKKLRGDATLYTKTFYIPHPELDLVVREKKRTFDANFIDVMFSILEITLLEKHKGLILKPSSTDKMRTLLLEKVTLMRQGDPVYAPHMSDPNAFNKELEHKVISVKIVAIARPDLTVEYMLRIVSCIIPEKAAPEQKIIQTDFRQDYFIPETSGLQEAYQNRYKE